MKKYQEVSKSGRYLICDDIRVSESATHFYFLPHSTASGEPLGAKKGTNISVPLLNRR
jgi:hypothetical protein